jgi:hypothetical protein
LSLLACLMVAEGGHPNFTGVWVLNLQRSVLELEQARRIDGGRLDITHADPVFKFRRTFRVADRSYPFTYELWTDGSEAEGERDGRHFRSRLVWEGDALVYSTRFIRAEGASTNVVRYTIEDKGHTLRADETFNGPQLRYHNVWVFDRQDR